MTSAGSIALPGSLSACIKRTAHELSKLDYAEHRQELTNLALQRLAAGDTAEVVIASIERQLLAVLFDRQP